MIRILFQDHAITVTEDFIRVHRLQDEVIPINRISSAHRQKIKTGDFKAVSIFFVLISLPLLFLFPIALLYTVPMAIVSSTKDKYIHTLVVTIKGYDTRLIDSDQAGYINQAVRMINASVCKNQGNAVHLEST